MARRKHKKQDHPGASNGPAGKVSSANSVSRAGSPKSMVIRIGAGDVGPSVSQLVKDVRAMMEPDTASRLKERKANRLRDYLTMAGPLGVTHLMLFSRSDSGNTNMRLALTPRGPTLHFQVEKYSLCKDVRSALKHPKGGGKEYITPPLLVMNNFTTPAAADPDSESKHNKITKQLESLTTDMFRGLFPPISPQTAPLSSIRRVMLLNRELPKDGDDGSYIINLRHYAITTKAVGLSRPLRRLNAAEKMLNSQRTKGKKGGLPNLGKLEDIADYMVGGADGSGYMTDATSGSEVDTDAEVEVVETRAKKILSKRKQDREDGKGKSSGAGVEKRAVKMVELGPRMRLRMTKVENGICDGKVMWHEYIHKSKEEVKAMDKAWEKKRQEKEARKKVQRENVERKRAAKKQDPKGGEEEEDNDEEMVDEWDSEGLEGDGEMELNEEMEDNGEWESEAEEIAGG